MTGGSGRYVRTAARSSGRLRAMSAETTPTSVTPGTSRPLVTRLVPTSTSIAPSVKASTNHPTPPLHPHPPRPPARHVEALGDEPRPPQHVDRAGGEGIHDQLGGALALDHVAVEPAHPQKGKALGDLALEALGAAAEIADAGGGAGRAARRRRRGRAAVMAAQGHAHGVKDEGPTALGADLHVAAIAAEDDARAAPTVEDEDGALPDGRVEAAQRVGQGTGEQRSIAGRELRPQVDDLDRRGTAGDALRQREAAELPPLPPAHPRP